MHTRDQLFGSVCRCLNCAQARDERIMREARKRRRDQWLAMIDKEDCVDELRAQLEEAQKQTYNARRELREETLNELRDEQGGT